MKPAFLNTQEQHFLLSLARETITAMVRKGETYEISEEDIPFPQLKEDRAVFVTLTEENALRGCIGHLEPVLPLYQDVMENAISSAISDPRFHRVSPDELDHIRIEISVLGIPQKFEYPSVSELIAKLEKEKPGVIIKKDFYQATFLPQVWEDIASPEAFLSHLCAKAGLAPSAWADGDLEVQTYSVQKFQEEK